MIDMSKKLPPEALVRLKQMLDELPPRAAARRQLMEKGASSYGISLQSLYRQLSNHFKPRSAKRADYGCPRQLSQELMVKYCELIAALRVRTTHKKNRNLSTSESIRILEEYGVETEEGLVKIPHGILSKSTVNRYLKHFNLTSDSFHKQAPAVRFQAEKSNELWHFDLSPSDLKHIDKPPWIREDARKPTLMLFSVVDDRSGVSYQEYRCVYGEDTESALRFLFNAMTIKNNPDLIFHGIPNAIYMDCGPISKSRIFKQVMSSLGVDVKVHQPSSKSKNKTTARAKGKVERPFRTVKEMHETLYHFHKPETEGEANQWLQRFLIRYNNMKHRSENHSRIDDWNKNISQNGLRLMCKWEKFCSFAREREQRKVAIDATIAAFGTKYSVPPDLAGEYVNVWWGMLEHEIYIDFDDKKYGPFHPQSAPLPLNRFRSFKKTSFEKRNDKIRELADSIAIPRRALEEGVRVDIDHRSKIEPHKVRVFTETYQNVIQAKLAISNQLNLPLAKLSEEMREKINDILKKSLEKDYINKKIRDLQAGGELYVS